MDWKKYGFIKIIPGEDELRGYLNQCTSYVDKRCFMELSYSIVEFCREKDIAKMNYEEVCKVLDHFNMRPEFLFYAESQKDNPTYYNNIRPFETPSGLIFILEALGGNVFNLANSLGTEMENIRYEELDKISWAESSAIEDVEFLPDYSILIWYIGRYTSWAIYEYNGINLLLRDAGSFIKGKANPPDIPEIIENRKTVNSEIFDIGYKMPVENDLRAYLYQLINSGFDISESVKKDILILTNQKKIPDLNQIDVHEIRIILHKHNLYPEKLFYFKKEFELFLKMHGTDPEGNLPYMFYPTLFTHIREVSFDCGGLIIMGYFQSQIYKLHQASGKELTDFCYDLRFLPEGRFISRYKEKKMQFFINAYNTEEQRIHVLMTGNDFETESQFLPFLNERDLIFENFYPNIGLWSAMNDFKGDVKKEDLKAILERNIIWTGSRDLVNFYSGDEKLAIIPLKNIRRFSAYYRNP